MTSEQLSEWEAYDKLDPIGTWREDFRMAYLASLITNIARSVHGKQGTTMTTLEDFMPDWAGERKEVEPKKQSVDEMKQLLLSIASNQNKKLNRRKQLPSPNNVKP